MIQNDFEQKLSYSRVPKINLSEKEEGSGAPDIDQSVTDTNSLITSQLIRLNQLMKGIRRDEVESDDITPDKLNEFLAIQNIQAETTTQPYVDDKSKVPNKLIESDDVDVILNLTDSITTTQVPPDPMLVPLALPTGVTKVTGNVDQIDELNKVTKLSSTDGTRNKGDSGPRTDSEKLQDLIASLKASTLTPHQQIIVHRPGGSVWFNVPTSTEKSTTPTPPSPPAPQHYYQQLPQFQQQYQPVMTTPKPPGFSEEVLRLLLELSKQLVTNQNQKPIQTPESVLQPVVRPIYINVPVQTPPPPTQLSSNNRPSYYDDPPPKKSKPKPLVNSYGEKLPSYPPLQEDEYEEQDYTEDESNRKPLSTPNRYSPDSNYPNQRPVQQKKPSYYVNSNRVDTNYNNRYNTGYDYTKPVDYSHYYYDPNHYQQNFNNYQPQTSYENPFYQDFSSPAANFYKPYQQQPVQQSSYAQPAFHFSNAGSSGIVSPGANGLITQFNNVGQSISNDNIHSQFSDDTVIDPVNGDEQDVEEGEEEEADNTRKKYVDLGGNIFSYDQYVSSILPLLQSTDKIQDAQVVTCTAGARQPNRTDCTKYFLCNPKSGGIYSFTCPLNTAFDEESKFCNRKRYTECKQQQTKSTNTFKLHMEALKALEEAKRIKDELVQAQNYASFLNYQNMRPKKKTTTTPAPLTRDSIPFLAALIQNYKNQQPLVVTTTPKTITRRRITCLQPGKVPDPDTKDHYYVCFKTPENYLKLHKMKCPMNFHFCKSTLLCAPKEKCPGNGMGR